MINIEIVDKHGLRNHSFLSLLAFSGCTFFLGLNRKVKIVYNKYPKINVNMNICNYISRFLLS